MMLRDFAHQVYLESKGKVKIPSFLCDELDAYMKTRGQAVPDTCTATEFSDALAQLIRDGILEQEEDRLYFAKTKDHEDAAASSLAGILSNNQLLHIQLPDELVFRDIALTDEQRQAVSLALKHRLSIIQGGAGSGKTALVKAIIRQHDKKDGPVLPCAPQVGRPQSCQTHKISCDNDPPRF